ncbi:hypothetical protein [Streptomyces bauhiniae]|uniref:hypothetical protein n=1 Tax=Streptomyces bauhiniae TaxID=2340725 RepID=UPI00142F1121|nr:hypothetical protein [Streptomyces bauhiniae]
MSSAVPSFRAWALPPEEAVGVERLPGRERYVPPSLPPVLAPRSYAPLLDEPS